MNPISAMTVEMPNFDERILEFNKMRIREYLKFGSVDRVLEASQYTLPISSPSLHRLLNDWGIVKTAGPNTTLSEVITFLFLLSDQKTHVERLYKSFPLSVKRSVETSVVTMYRILHNIKEKIVRRCGTALIITPADDSTKILVGNDISTERLKLGKPFGSLSFPMGYSSLLEDARTSILRELQREALMQQTVDRKFPYEIIPKHPQPVGKVIIGDVAVSVYHLTGFSEITDYSSDKLAGFRYAPLPELLISGASRKYRAGIEEMAQAYKDSLAGATAVTQLSSLNLALAERSLD